MRRRRGTGRPPVGRRFRTASRPSPRETAAAARRGTRFHPCPASTRRGARPRARPGSQPRAPPRRRPQVPRSPALPARAQPRDLSETEGDHPQAPHVSPTFNLPRVAIPASSFVAPRFPVRLPTGRRGRRFSSRRSRGDHQAPRPPGRPADERRVAKDGPRELPSPIAAAGAAGNSNRLSFSAIRPCLHIPEKGANYNEYSCGRAPLARTSPICYESATCR